MSNESFEVGTRIEKGTSTSLLQMSSALRRNKKLLEVCNGKRMEAEDVPRCEESP